MEWKVEVLGLMVEDGDELANEGVERRPVRGDHPRP